MAIDRSYIGRVFTLAAWLLALPIGAAAQDDFPRKAVHIIVPRRG